MRWWSRFLKSRRQSDRVKIMFLLILTGIGFLGDSIYRGIQVYQDVNLPVEYVLTNSSGNITDVQIAELQKLEDIEAVSRQQEADVTFSCGEMQLTVPCLELSADYLETVYGIQKTGSMKTFYLNQTAWEQIQQAEGGGNEEETAVLQRKYTLADGREEPESGTAKMILLEELAEEESCAVCAHTYVKTMDGSSQGGGNGASRSGAAETVRVQAGSQDMDGGNLKHLNQLGFETADPAEAKQTLLIQEMQFLRMKYDLLIAGLCFLSAGCLKKLKKG